MKNYSAEVIDFVAWCLSQDGDDTRSIQKMLHCTMFEAQTVCNQAKKKMPGSGSAKSPVARRAISVAEGSRETVGRPPAQYSNINHLTHYS